LFQQTTAIDHLGKLIGFIFLPRDARRAKRGIAS